MHIFVSGVTLGWTKYRDAYDILRWMKESIEAEGVVRFADIWIRSHRVIPDIWRSACFWYGYARKDIRRMKPVRTDTGYLLIFPPPKRIINAQDGGLTTED